MGFIPYIWFMNRLHSFVSFSFLFWVVTMNIVAFADVEFGLKFKVPHFYLDFTFKIIFALKTVEKFRLSQRT